MAGSSPLTLKLTIDRKFKDSVKAARKVSAYAQQQQHHQQQQQQQLTPPVHVPCSPVFDAPLTPDSFYPTIEHLKQETKPIHQPMYVDVSSQRHHQQHQQQQQQQLSFVQQQQTQLQQQQQQQQQQFVSSSPYLSDLDGLGFTDLLPLVQSNWSLDLAYLDVCNKLTDSDINNFYGNGDVMVQPSYASLPYNDLVTSDYSTPEVSEMMDANWFDVALTSTLGGQ